MLLTAIVEDDEVRQALAEHRIARAHPKPWIMSELMAALRGLIGR